MKAKELIKILRSNPEAEILVSSDEEGNSFSTISTQSIEVHKDKIVIYPWEEGIEIE